MPANLNRTRDKIADLKEKSDSATGYADTLEEVLEFLGGEDNDLGTAATEDIGEIAGKVPLIGTDEGKVPVLGAGGKIDEARIPDEIPRSSEIRDFAKVGDAAEVPDDKIPSGIARDSEIEDFAKTGDSTQIPDEKIPSTIARDSAIPSNATIDSRARALISDWAQEGNQERMPDDKLPASPPDGWGGGTGGSGSSTFTGLTDTPSAGSGDQWLKWNAAGTALVNTSAPAASAPDASETAKGVIEIADDGEADTGTDNTRAMTPHQVKRQIDAIPSPAAPTWASITNKPTLAPSDAEQNIQANWTETDSNSDAFIRNKPTLAPSTAEANVQADWDETTTSSDAYIHNKPTVLSQSDVDGRILPQARTGNTDRFPADKLGTGSATSSKVLYGDRVWRDAPTGGNGGGLDASQVRGNVADQIQAGQGFAKTVGGSGSTQTLTIAGVDASDSQKGIVEIATNSESSAGTSSTLAVSPQGLTHTIDQRVHDWARDASTDVPDSKIPAGITRDSEVEDFALATNTTTLVPTSKLGTGSAGNTRYLRGDGTWHTPPAGSGGGGTPVSLEEVVRTSDLPVSTGSSAGTWTSWNDLVNSAALSTAGVVRVFGAVHGEVTTPPDAGGGDRVYLEMRVVRTRATVDTTLEDTFVYVRNTGNAVGGETNAVSGKFGFPLAIADTGEVNDVYKIQVRVLSQVASRTVTFDRDTKIELVTGGGGLSQSDVDARVTAGVHTWAEQSDNTTKIPDSKIPDAITRDSEIEDFAKSTENTRVQSVKLGSGTADSSTILHGDGVWRDKSTAGKTQAQIDARVEAGTLEYARAGNTATWPTNKVPSLSDLGGLSQSDVDDRIESEVEDWAHDGDTSTIPDSKIPTGITRTSILEDFAKSGNSTDVPDNKIPASITRDNEVENFAKTANSTTLVPAAKLGGGTADNSKILYGDGQWRDAPSTDGVDASGVRTEVAGQIRAGEGIDLTAAGSGANQTLTIVGEDASTTNKGIIQISTQSQADGGTDTSTAMTPALVERRIGEEVEDFAKAGDGTQISDAKIPTSITRDAELEAFALTTNTSSRVPIAKLGSGSAGTGRFLRGDGSWQTPPGGSGLGGGSPVSLEEVSRDTHLDVTNASAGTWSAWTSLVNSASLGSAGVVRVFGAVHGSVRSAATDGADRVFLEMRIVRRRGSTDHVLEDTYVYVRHLYDADVALTNTVSGLFGFPLAIADDGEVNDVYRLDVRVLSQKASRTIRFDTETKIELVTGGGGLSEAQVDDRILPEARDGNTDRWGVSKVPTLATLGGLNQTEVDARVSNGVHTWAESSDSTTTIPDAKIPASIARDSEVRTDAQINSLADARVVAGTLTQARTGDTSRWPTNKVPSITDLGGITGTTVNDRITAAATPDASESVKGKIEIANNAEADAGTDNLRAMTPLQVKRRIDAIPAVGNASETARGVVELATTTEASDGTDTDRAVTPAGLAARTPDATTTAKGLVNLASTSEASTGTNTTKAVTPAGLATRTPDSSETDKGLIQIATSGDASTGTDNTKAMTPALVKARIDDIPAQPDASATAKGLVELATNDEATTGTDTTRAVTPAGLAARTPDASESAKGLVNLASTSEAGTGTNTTKAVTPAGLAARTPDATESAKGLVELANTAEANAGTDSTRAMTPALVKARIDAEAPSDATTSTSGLMSSGDKTKLEGIATGAEVNVQSDWDVTDTTSDAFIQHKPAIPTIPGVATTSANGLMASGDKSKLNGIANGAEVNVQADWNENTVTHDAHILNKPTIPAEYTNTMADARISALVESWALNSATDSTQATEIVRLLKTLTGTNRLPSSAVDDLVTVTATSVASQSDLNGITTDDRVAFAIITTAFTPWARNDILVFDHAEGAQGAWNRVGSTSVGVAATNLSTTRTATAVTVVSSAGTNAVINEATSTNAGVMTTTMHDKLEGIATGAEVNVQSDWNAASSSDAYIHNKPTIPAAQVPANWNATTGVSRILNKPTIPAAPVPATETAAGIIEIANDGEADTGTNDTLAMTPALVKRRIEASVHNWARDGSTDVPDDKIPASITRDTEVENFAKVGNATQIPDAKIPSTIARDSEIPSNATIDSRARALIADWAEQGNASTVPDSKIPASIARDSELPTLTSLGALNQSQVDARVRTGVHDWAESNDSTTTIPDSKIPSSIARDTEIPSNSDIDTRANNRVGALVENFAKAGNSAQVPDAKIPSTIARDSEVPTNAQIDSRADARVTAGTLPEARAGSAGRWAKAKMPTDTVYTADLPANASETVRGLIEIASSGEASTGTDNTTAMTPLRVKERISALVENWALEGASDSVQATEIVRLLGTLTGANRLSSQHVRNLVTVTSTAVGDQTALSGITTTDRVAFAVVTSAFPKASGRTGSWAQNDILVYDHNDSRWERVGSTATGAAATNLGVTRTASSVTITSSSGDDVAIPVAGTGSQAGIMTDAQADRLAGIAEGAEVNVQADWDQNTVTHDAHILNKPTVLSQADVDARVVSGTLLHARAGNTDQWPVAKLGSGTASSNKVLYGDGTWKDVPDGGGKGRKIAECTLPIGVQTAGSQIGITWTIESGFTTDYTTTIGHLFVPRCLDHPGWLVEVMVGTEISSCSWIASTALDDGGGRADTKGNFSQTYKLGCTVFGGTAGTRAVNMEFQQQITERHKDVFRLYGAGQGAILANTKIVLYEWLAKGEKGDKGDKGDAADPVVLEEDLLDNPDGNDPPSVSITTGSLRGRWTNWTTLVTSSILTRDKAGVVRLFGAVHGEVTTDPAGGGDRVYLEMRITRTRGSVVTRLEDNYVYVRNTGNANPSPSDTDNKTNEVSGKFGFPLAIADDGEQGDVYKLDVRVLSQEPSRSVEFDKDTKLELVTGSGGRPRGFLIEASPAADVNQTSHATIAGTWTSYVDLASLPPITAEQAGNIDIHTHVHFECTSSVTAGDERFMTEIQIVKAATPDDDVVAHTTLYGPRNGGSFGNTGHGFAAASKMGDVDLQKKLLSSVGDIFKVQGRFMSQQPNRAIMFTRRDTWIEASAI